MKASEVIRDLAILIAEYGDKEVNIELLTDNNSNCFKIQSICDNYGINDKFLIVYEIDNVKEFKKSIK